MTYQQTNITDMNVAEGDTITLEYEMEENHQGSGEIVRHGLTVEDVGDGHFIVVDEAPLKVFEDGTVLKNPDDAYSVIREMGESDGWVTHGQNAEWEPAPIV